MKKNSIIFILFILFFTTCDNDNNNSDPNANPDYFGTWVYDTNDGTFVISANSLKYQSEFRNFTTPITWTPKINNNIETKNEYPNGYIITGSKFPAQWGNYVTFYLHINKNKMIEVSEDGNFYIYLILNKIE